MNPHFGFSGVPLINIINGQLSTKLLTRGCHNAISFSNCTLYSGDNFSSESKTSPISLLYILYNIFLAVCVKITVGVFST